MIASMQRRRRTRALGGVGVWVAAGWLLGVSGAWAAVPCEHAEATLRSAPVPERLATALDIVESGCQPLLPEILGAMQTRRWADRAPLTEEERATLLNAGVAGGYDEAIALSVSVLETGAWPGSEPLDLSTGARIVEGLAPALDGYRTLLLLDVYEQIDQPEVRMAVLRALRQGTGPEALVPVLDAYWTGKGAVQVLAAEIIAAQPEKKADAVLTRVARDLPKGAVLDWAARLAGTHGVGAAVEAAKRS